MSHAISANGEPRNYLNETYGIKSWLLTLDHKRIGILYLITLAVFFLVGSLFASLIRFELMTPQGDLVEAETYNKLFTMHGVVMIFFFLIPSIPAVLGNFLIPLQNRCPRCGLPSSESPQLLSLRGWGAVRRAGHYHGWH